MPRTLLVRAGGDTIRKMEAAAARRLAEANALATDHPLAAVYFYGYVVEIRLKAAYYRVVGLGPNDSPDAVGATGKSFRKHAESMINSAPPTVPHVSPAGKPVSPGHNVAGWAWLLEETRGSPPHVPLDPSLAAEMNRHAGNTFRLWSESLRYRANRPTPSELQVVQSAARWYARNAKRLQR